MLLPVFMLLCVLAAVLCLCACKPTDLFTEIVISPYSDEFIEDAETVIIDSPDATQESSQLTAFDWTEDSEQSEEIQNLVVFSSEPSTDLKAHHSHFDAAPRFPGIEASDGVRFVFGDSSAEHEADADAQDRSTDADVISAGGTDSTDDAEATLGDSSWTTDGSNGEATEDAAGGDAATSGDAEGGTDGTGAGDAGGNPGGGSGNGNEGSDKDPEGGYDGLVDEYDPNNGFSVLQKADQVAVLGTDAAVTVQAIGGKGAICAMSDYAYHGLDADGKETDCASTFAEVFAEQLPAKFEKDALIWAEDGSKPSDLDRGAGVDALVSACGTGGVIVYDQDLGSQNDLFSLAQRKKLQAADIQLVPVDFSTVDGICDAAAAAGEVLSESESCEVKNPEKKADSYVSCLKNIVRACAATHGDYVATEALHGGTLGGSDGLLTTFKKNPVKNLEVVDIFSPIAVDSSSQVLFANDYGIDTSRVLLFGTDDWKSTPLLFWQQVAGVWCDTFDGGVEGRLQLFWPLYRVRPESPSALLGGTASALTQWSNAADTEANTMHYAITGYSGTDIRYDGLGTSHMPYLIVCASDDKSAAEVKEATVQSMTSYVDGGSVTPYSIVKQNFNVIGGDNGAGLTTVGATEGAVNNNANGTSWGDNPFEPNGSLSADDVVRENPSGLLGSWTQGNTESVLESVWLTGLYSDSPDGCAYTPACDMSKFDLTVSYGDYSEHIDGSSSEYGSGSDQAAIIEDTAKAFYQAFYDVDIDDISNKLYDKIVPDGGL
ncbi:MAG: hypothetical protein LUD25_01845 [Coriobacteriaceae bacterium]|nr:hypothetical protein [Coriobacteriaceae bacterium]